MCAVSIGVVLVSKDKDVPSEVVVGVIYNPILNEITSAVKGKGSYLNGNRIHVTEGGNDEIELSDALINVGFPAVKDSTLQAASRAVGALATKVRGLRMIASASQVMCWVAQGKLSAYVSWDLNAWDVAAGMLIVEESSGHVTDFDGQRASISSRDLIVTCPEGMSIQEESPLARKILRVLSENDCLEY
jgi:myo-inositol-1(or 4)-monophosphatase